MKLNTLPRIILVEDYHELIYLPTVIKDSLGIIVKCKELGYSQGQYVGLVYQGKFLSKKKIDFLLKNNGVEIESC